MPIHRPLDQTDLDQRARLSLGFGIGGRVPRVDTVEPLANALCLSPCLLAFGLQQTYEAVTESLMARLPARLSQIRQERAYSRRELGQRSDTSDKFVHR